MLPSCFFSVNVAFNFNCFSKLELLVKRSDVQSKILKPVVFVVLGFMTFVLRSKFKSILFVFKLALKPDKATTSNSQEDNFHLAT